GFPIPLARTGHHYLLSPRRQPGGEAGKVGHRPLLVVLGGAGVEDHQRAGGVEVEGGEQLVEPPLDHGARREAWVAGGQVDTGHRAADGGIVEEAVVTAVIEGHPLIESLAVAIVRANTPGDAGHGNELAANIVTFDSDGDGDGDGEASPGAPQLADK